MNTTKQQRRFPPLPPRLIALCCLCLTLATAGCSAPPPAAATATAMMPPSPPMQTVEVTRVVTQEIVVTATPAPPGACAPANAADATEIVVGVLAPFSQDAAWPRALAMQAGIGLAVEDANLAGGMAGKPLRVIMQDTAGDPATAERLAEQLVTHDCASALIGGFNTEEAAAIKQVSLRHNIPFLIIDATADELTSDLPATVFRLAPAASMIAQMPVQWLTTVGDFNDDGSQQVLVLAENSASADAALEQVNAVFPAAGINYEVLRVDAPAADYSPLIARVVTREQAADVILLYVMGDATLDLLRQLLDAGIGPQKGTLLVGGRAVLDGAQFWTHVPDGAFTVATRRGPWPTSVMPLGESFVERFRAYSAQWPEPVAFAAYDAIHLLADAAQRARSISPPDLVAALETTDITLASGYYNFPFNRSNPPDGVTEPAYLWHQWRDPQLLYLQYREPQQDPSTMDVLWPLRYRTVEEAALRP